MFKENEGKRYYNFGPTIKRNANPRYNQIDSISKAKAVKNELERTYGKRTWKIAKKY
jgi:hypothetical protein